MESPSNQKLSIESNQYCMQTLMSSKFLGDFHFLRLQTMFGRKSY
jgi:hypothetical protein